MFPTVPFDLPLLNLFLPAAEPPLWPGSQPGIVPAVGPTTAAVSSWRTCASSSNSHIKAAPKRDLAESYNWLAKYTQERLQAIGASSRPLPAQFAHRLSDNGKFTVVAQAWQVASDNRLLGDFRLVKIDGLRSHIINAWFFPKCPTHCPVFAAELIGVAEVTRVAFIDIQVPAAEAAIQHRASQLTSQLAASFRSLPCDEPAPDWAIEESPGYFTYGRSVSADELHSVCDCYTSYLDGFLANFMRSCSHLSAETAAVDQLHHYQLHHMQHSPGKKFLSNLFTPEWTDSFMLDFLFAPVGDQ